MTPTLVIINFRESVVTPDHGYATDCNDTVDSPEHVPLDNVTQSTGRAYTKETLPEHVPLDNVTQSTSRADTKETLPEPVDNVTPSTSCGDEKETLQKNLAKARVKVHRLQTKFQYAQTLIPQVKNNLETPIKMVSQYLEGFEKSGLGIYGHRGSLVTGNNQFCMSFRTRQLKPVSFILWCLTACKD